MKILFQTFRRNEDGATTVDYVVITACVISLSISATVAAKKGTVYLAGTISAEVENGD